MIFPNRIAQYSGIRSLLFILIASSIPHIYANTNPENPQSQIQDQNTESVSNNELISAPQEESAPTQPTQLKANPDLTAQDPVELQLNILAGMCEHIMDSVEKGKWNLLHDEAQKKALMEAVADTFSVACHLLKSFKEKKADVSTQYLYELIIQHQLEHINTLLLRKSLPESNLEDQIKTAQATEKTIDDLAQAIMKANSGFEALHLTLQDFDALDAQDVLGEHHAHSKKEISALDRTNDQVLKQLCTVDAILEELALFINNQSLKVPNASTALDAIKQARALIESRKYDRGEVTEKSIYDLLSLNKYLIGHVRTMISSDFNTILALDEAIYATRTKRDVTFEELDEKYKDNEKILKSLKAESQSAGLKGYHLFFRAIEPYWTKTLDGGRRIAWPLLSGFLATIALQQADLLPTWFDFKISNDMYFYGDRWSAKKENGIPEQPDPKFGGRIGLISNLYHGINPFVTNTLVLSIAGLAGLYGMSDFKKMKKAASDLLTKTGNFLLGKKETKQRNELTHVEPKYTFADVIGQQEIKEDLSIIVRYFEDPQGIDNRGLKLEKGYLFTGKTRSGKSFMAEALAGEIRAALKRAGKDEKAFKFIIAPAEILRQMGGFHLCMEHARRHAPCILFIDEIHLLDLQAGKNNALLGEFLTELSGCMSNDPESKVFVIAATNHEDALDKALRQSGRLSKEIRFEYPTYADRRAFIVNIFERRTINVQSDKWARAINQLARETEDCTYEDIRKIIEGAFITAKIKGEAIDADHLNHSFDRNIRGIIPVHDREISEQERQIAAAHQAGYVLATRILAPQVSIVKVTTLPIQEGIKERSLWSQWNDKGDDPKNDRIIYGKMFTYGKKMRDMLVTTQEQLNACIIALSGYAAGNVQLGAANNSSAYLPEKRQEAFDIAKMTIAKGIKVDDFNDSLKNEFLKRAMALRSACETKAALLMEQNKEALNAVYTALLKHSTLTGKAIDTILAQHKLKGLEVDQNILSFVEASPIAA